MAFLSLSSFFALRQNEFRRGSSRPFSETPKSLTVIEPVRFFFFCASSFRVISPPDARMRFDDSLIDGLVGTGSLFGRENRVCLLP